MPEKRAKGSPVGLAACSVPCGGRCARLDVAQQNLDASRTVLRSVEIPAQAQNNDWMVTWTADSQSVVVGAQGRLHRAYAASDLGRSVPLPQEAQKGRASTASSECRGARSPC